MKNKILMPCIYILGEERLPEYKGNKIGNGLAKIKKAGVLLCNAPAFDIDSII